MGDNVEFAGKNYKPHSPKLPEIKPFFEAATKFDFSKFCQTDDFGKDSLGFHDMNRSDFGRESLFFLRDDSGRDSLGILNLTNIDIGRQSLTLSNLKPCDFIQKYDANGNRNISLTKIEEDLKLIESDLVNSSFLKSPRTVGDFPRFSQKDFGKESLGILDFNNIDYGRQSLIFMPDNPARDSLGILNLNNIDMGKESLGFTNTLNKSTSPNLKILENNDIKNNINSVKNTSDESETDLTSKKVPDLLITVSDNSSNTLSFLNVGYPKLPLPSFTSSTSSIYVSFNSASLENTTTSKISSISSNIDPLNEAFCGTTDYLRRMKSTLSVPSPNLNSSSFVDDVFSSPHISKRTDNKIDSEFKEAIFMEARRVAECLAEGNFEEKENDMLDCTQEPADFANVLIDEEPVKYDTETVFKTIDKLFVPSCEKYISVEDNLPKHSDNSSGQSERNSSRNSEKSGGSNSKSKEALEIIHTLSEILNSDKPKKEEGQNLLSNLAEIISCSASTQSRSGILDDSGHSSIEEEIPLTSEGGEVYEVLDLRKKSASTSNLMESETETCAPLDLSMKSQSFASPKCLPPKYNRAPRRATVSLNINYSFNSNYSISSNESKNLSDGGKFKPKKTTSVKRGPLKAVHPANNMTKTNVVGSHLKITPTRTDSKTTISKMKKTSTPINDPTLKPMAQSTPEYKKIPFPTSPLAKANSSVLGSKCLNSKNDTGMKSSVNKSLNSKMGHSRLRKSSDELRQNQTPQTQITRSYSMESKPTSHSSRTSVFKPSVRRGSFSYSKTDKSAAILTESKNKFTGRASLIRNFGKENLRK